MQGSQEEGPRRAPAPRSTDRATPDFRVQAIRGCRSDFTRVHWSSRSVHSMRDGPHVANANIKPLSIVIQIMPGGLSFVMVSRWWSRAA